MGPVVFLCRVVSLGVGAFLGAFFLCRICFLRGFYSLVMTEGLLVCLWLVF